MKNGILLPKFCRPTVRKKCSSDREKVLKFKAENPEFAKSLRSLEQTVKGQLFQRVPGGFSDLMNWNNYI